MTIQTKREKIRNVPSIEELRKVALRACLGKLIKELGHE